jgi:hypothetical protein
MASTQTLQNNSALTKLLGDIRSEHKISWQLSELDLCAPTLTLMWLYLFSGEELLTSGSFIKANVADRQIFRFRDSRSDRATASIADCWSTRLALSIATFGTREHRRTSLSSESYCYYDGVSRQWRSAFISGADY